MKRFAALFASLAFITAIAAPVALAADETLPHSGRVLMAFGGDITVPAGEQADVVFVANGDADIAGTVEKLSYDHLIELPECVVTVSRQGRMLVGIFI